MSVLKASVGAALFVVAAALAWAIGHSAGNPSTRSHAADSTPAKTPTKDGHARDAWQDIVDQGGGSPRSAVSRAGSRDQPQSGLPSGPFGANIDELKRRADAGDAGAAKTLADGYRHCEFYVPPKDQTDLEKRVEDDTVGQLNLVDQIVDQVKDKARERGVEIGKIPEQAPLPAYQAQMKAETQLAQDCHGVGAGDAKKWPDWYARAAELGDPDAEIGYWHVAFSRADIVPLDEIQRDKIAAADDLQRALARGDWRALAAIGSIFEAGYYADPDPFLAHAYGFAASQAAASDISDITVLPWMSGGFLVRIAAGNDTRSYLGQMLRRTAATLDSPQIAESERMGAALYASCCTGGRQ